MNLDFKQTSIACPEQYDVYDVDKKDIVAYIRIRWGQVEVSCYGQTIYSDEINGDGTFESESERQKYFNVIKQKIEEYFRRI